MDKQSEDFDNPHFVHILLLLFFYRCYYLREKLCEPISVPSAKISTR